MRRELGEKTPRQSDNLTCVNYTDYCGQPVPRDVDVDFIDEEYLRDALWEFEAFDEDLDRIEEVAGSNRPQTGATTTASSAPGGHVTARQTSQSARLNSDYFAWASVPALKNISRNFQKSARLNYAPRDFSDIRNVYSKSLRPS